MRKRRIKAWIIALPLLMLSFNWYTYADDDFDCTTLDMDTMDEIREKLDSGEDLTSDEEETLESAESCGWPQWWMWEGGWEWEMWEGWPQWWMWGEWEEWAPVFEWDEEDDTVDEDTGLSTNMQTAIDNAIDWIEEQFSDLDDDDKIDVYEAIIEKLEAKLEIITESDDIDEEQQELFENIIEEMVSQLESLIEELED